jgi:hypothetical protein
MTSDYPSGPAALFADLAHKEPMAPWLGQRVWVPKDIYLPISESNPAVPATVVRLFGPVTGGTCVALHFDGDPEEMRFVRTLSL